MWRLAGAVVRANLMVRFKKKELFLPGETVEALEVALRIEVLHLPLFQSPLEHIGSGFLIGDDIARFDGEGIFE